MSAARTDCTCARGGNADTCECREVSAARTPTNLSERIRPDSEAAPWVVEEVKAMERQRDALVAALEACAVSRSADYSRQVAQAALAAINHTPAGEQTRATLKAARGES